MKNSICSFLAFVFAASVLISQNALAQTTSISPAGFQGSRIASGHNSNVPTEWGDEKNVIWKFAILGAGASSPIIVGDKIFVTCFGGYGLDQRKPGKLETLVRTLLCVDLETGKQLWEASVPNGDKEDKMTSQISDHGYASSTPVSDGTHVFTFFGKAGVTAFDMNGKQLWHSDVGNKSSQFQQGSGSSPILFENLVIVNAADEGRAVIALDKTDGKEVWRAESEKLDGSYVTPALVKSSNGTFELVVSMINEAWGLDPATGKSLWKLTTRQDGSVVPTAIVDREKFYLFGGMGGTTYALDSGGRGDLTERNAIWTSRHGSTVSSPLLHEGHLYWANMQGIAYCVKTDDGTLVYRERLGKKAGCYASPVLANGNIYYVTRTEGTYVVAAKPKFSIIAQSQFDSDKTRFDGTPYIIDGRIYLRSNKTLYCLGSD